MPLDINSVTLAGRITKDPEIKYTQNNTAYCNFSIAVGDGKRGDKEVTYFIGVTAWAKQAENMSQYVKKGDMIGITGKINQDSWTDQQGNKQSKTYVNATLVHFLRKSQGGGQQRPPAQPQQPNSGGFAGPQNEPELNF